MKKLIVLFALVLTVSCVSDDPVCCTNISSTFNFYVVDADGTDLLDASAINSIPTHQIRVFKMIDGVKKEMNQGNLDAPRHFSIYSPEDSNWDKNYISLFLNIEDSNEITTTFFQWDEDTIDEFKSEVVRTDNSVIVTKVWLNNVLVWDTDSTETIFEYVR